MENILIRVSQNGSTWQDLQIPSSYKINYEDIDDDSYRSKLSGNLIRRRISPRWVKIELSYNFVTSEQLNTIARQINTNQKFYVRCKSPAFGNMGASNTWTQFKAYVSNYHAEMLPLQSGWTLNFNIIQSDIGGQNG